MKVQFGSLLRFKYTFAAVDPRHDELFKQITPEVEATKRKRRKMGMSATKGPRKGRTTPRRISSVEDRAREALWETEYSKDAAGTILKTHQRLIADVNTRFPQITFIGETLSGAVGSSFIDIATGIGPQPIDRAVVDFVTGQKLEQVKSGKAAELVHSGLITPVSYKSDSPSPPGQPRYIMVNVNHKLGIIFEKVGNKYVYKEPIELRNFDQTMSLDEVKEAQKETDKIREFEALRALHILRGDGEYRKDYAKKLD